jgi:hypothetical protein
MIKPAGGQARPPAAAPRTAIYSTVLASTSPDRLGRSGWQEPPRMGIYFLARTTKASRSIARRSALR